MSGQEGEGHQADQGATATGDPGRAGTGIVKPAKSAWDWIGPVIQECARCSAEFTAGQLGSPCPVCGWKESAT